MKLILFFLKLFFICFIFPSQYYANHISGVITDLNGEPLPYASIYIKNSTYGVSSNVFGEYFIELNPGTYTIVYSYIGFESLEKTINLKVNPLNIDIILKESDENSVVDFLVNEGSSYYLELVQNATGEGYELNSSEEMDEFQQQVIEGIEELVN